jgi:hypothetical protein
MSRSHGTWYDEDGMTLRSKPRSAGLALVFLGASALLASGCGSDKRLTKAEYEQKAQSIYDDVRKAFQGTGTNVPSLDTLAERVRVAQQELRGAAEEFSKLKPPSEVEDPNRDVAEGLEAYADDLDRLHDAAAAGNAKRVTAFEQRIPENESVMKIEESAEEMKSKGYNLGALTTD